MIRAAPARSVPLLIPDEASSIPIDDGAAGLPLEIERVALEDRGTALAEASRDAAAFEVQTPGGEIEIGHFVEGGSGAKDDGSRSSAEAGRDTLLFAAIDDDGDVGLRVTVEVACQVGWNNRARGSVVGAGGVEASGDLRRLG